MTRAVAAALLLVLAHGAAAEDPADRFLAARCVELDSAGICAVYGVSMVELLANPERFHGRTVSVRGYVRLEFEGNAIYLSKESYEARSTRDALWLDPPAQSAPAGPGATWGPGYAHVRGRFDALDRGHMGMYSGAIVKTTHFVPR